MNTMADKRVTRSLYATHATELLRIAHTGWNVAVHRTPVGVFYRLEKGLLYRGGQLKGWWWTPTLNKALAHLLREALAHPRRTAPQHYGAHYGRP